MERATTIKRIKNLKKIKEIVEIAKFDTIHKLSKIQKIKNHHYSMALSTKKIIVFARLKHNFLSVISKNTIQKITNKNLWVFITIPSILIKISYLHFENMILKEFDIKNDSIIVVGDPAIKFANKNKYKIFAEYNNLDNSSNNVSKLINNSIVENVFDKIIIVSNDPEIKKKPFQIYPVLSEDFDLNELKNEFYNYKFYHSISEIINNISSTYVFNTISGIYQNTKRHFFQEKFARHEASIKTINSRIQKFKNNLNKLDRKFETEELIHAIKILRGK